jgi:hypothetical protein
LMRFTPTIGKLIRISPCRSKLNQMKFGPKKLV